MDTNRFKLISTRRSPLGSETSATDGFRNEVHSKQYIASLPSTAGTFRILLSFHDDPPNLLLMGQA